MFKFLFLVFCAHGQGLEVPLAPENIEPLVTRYHLMAQYLPLDLFVPSKIGLSAAYDPGDRRFFEIEYVRASLNAPFYLGNIGGLSDQRWTFMRRNFVGAGSFNWSYGVSYMIFDIHLGNSYLSRIPNAPGSLDLLSIETLGAMIGVGNRWPLGKGFEFGVDWFVYTQPLLTTKRQGVFLDYASGSERDEVSTAFNLVTYFPRLTLGKVQLGWSF